LKDSECSIIIKNILQGIEYLAQNGVIHRDLKPDNIMFKRKDDLNSLVICDLGIAGELKNMYSFMDCKCGTLTFMAPEIIMNRQYDNLVDIWSTGIIMYILESGGSHPLLYESKTRDEFIEDIKAKKEFYFPNHFPLLARNIFLKMCKYEPCSRYNVIKALEHPWITRKNKNIPLTVIEEAQKKDKINTFKEMLLSMTVIKQLKDILNIHAIEKNNENSSSNTYDNDIIKRKLNIKKGKINSDLYPSPYNYYSSIPKRHNSSSIRELPVLTRPNSKYETNNNNNNHNNKSILKLKSYNTDKKKSIRFSIYSKNALPNKAKLNIDNCKSLQSNQLNQCKIIQKKTSSKSKLKLVNIIKKKTKLSSAITDKYIEKENELSKTPVLVKKKSYRNIKNNEVHFTSKLIKNKENININLMNNINNNFSNRKSNNNICFKVLRKMNMIEPRNLFPMANNNEPIKYVRSDFIKKNS
jgi:serine/threonine protein kinase